MIADRPTVQPPVRRAIRLHGVVQGVGFRPYVHALARQYGLVGLVRNDDDGVHVEVQGDPARVDAFLAELPRRAPAQARIDGLSVLDRPVQQEAAFVIAPSAVGGGGLLPVSADLATCAECWREFRDPADRRHRYPFLNCTHCGPRYTIVRDVPYDRGRTTMAGFAMCARCRAEYDDPASRRFHAQPNACPDCGPRLAWRATEGAREGTPIAAHDGPTGEAALAAALAVLRRGGIIAAKGVGGYHLLCDATNPAAVARLRERKRRPHKPFAVLAADLGTVRRFAVVSDAAAERMASAAAPIVLLPLREAPDLALAEAVAPGLDVVGVMLPYTPLHALLAADGPVVCTSGNLADEPIAHDDADALRRLGTLVDGVLAHDRPIHVPCDDSVLALDGEDRDLPVRRSRGYAPDPVRLPFPVPPVFAVGGELKATVALTRGPYAFLSGHLGDVGSPETLSALTQAGEHLARLFRVRPARVACDRHPDYLSSRWARAHAATLGVPLVAVQHHHAHLAALMAEHGLDGASRLLAFTWDGTGYGTDGTIWGGELLLGGYGAARRVGTITPMPLPGGDAAVRHPARMALAALWAAGLPWDDRLPAVAAVPDAERRVLRTQLERRIGCATTTSMGRLLDACAALAGGRGVATYEGQAAIEFEVAARRARDAAAPGLALACPVREGDGGLLRLDTRALLAGVAEAAADGVPLAPLALAVHHALADATVAMAVAAADRHGAHPIGLTGGVFQNRLLLGTARRALEGAGFRVLTHRLVPPNDGGLALGQAMVAACSEPAVPSS